MIRGYGDHAANERTFLAWLRTSIAVIAFGVVVEKLNLFALTAISVPSLNEASRSQLEKLSGPLGRGAGHAFIVVGIFFIVVATFRFVRIGRLLNDSSIHSPGILPDIIFAVILCRAACIQIGDDYPAVGLNIAPRNAMADAACRTGNEGDLVVKLHGMTLLNLSDSRTRPCPVRA
jgi:putative membrane protein